MPQPCSSLRLVLTFERATLRVGGDFLGVDRARRQIEQGVDLGDGAVDAPAGAHFPPMKDELLFDRRELASLFLSFLSIQKLTIITGIRQEENLPIAYGEIRDSVELRSTEVGLTGFQA